MKTLVKNEFRQTRKTLLIWLGIMLLLCGFCYFELLSLKDSLDEMARTVGQFPRLIMIMFGVKGDLTTALGWYACIYFWEGLLAFAYAISLGLSCVAREKKFGTSEYLFTKPVERKTIVLAKVIVSSVNLLVFSLFSGVCNYFAVILPMGGLEQPGAEIATAFGMFFFRIKKEDRQACADLPEAWGECSPCAVKWTCGNSKRTLYHVGDYFILRIAA